MSSSLGPTAQDQSLSTNLMIFQFLSPDLIISHQSPFWFLGREGLPWETGERKKGQEGGSTQQVLVGHRFSRAWLVTGNAKVNKAQALLSRIWGLGG